MVSPKDDAIMWWVGVVLVILASPALLPYWLWLFLWPRLRDRVGSQLAWTLVSIPGVLAVIAYLIATNIGGSIQTSAEAFIASQTTLKGDTNLLWLAVKIFTLCSTVGAPIYIGIGILIRPTIARGSHGTAYWASYRDVADAFPIRDESHLGGPMLGRMKGVPRKFDPCYRTRQHVLTFAPTGSGKGIGCVVPNLLKYPGASFVLDVKGENWAVTRRRRREGLHEIFAIDPFGITQEPSATVDLFAAINPASEECVSEAAALVETLIVRSPSGDPHWDDSAANLLQGLVLHVSTLEESRRHLGTLREILTMPEPKLAALMDRLSDATSAFGLIARSANALLAKADRERSSVVSTALRHTAFLDDPRVVRTLQGGNDAVNFAALKRGPMTVYLCIPPDKLEAYRGYVRAILGSALKAMIRSREQPQMPILFLVDEMAQLGYFKPLEDSVSLLRGYGVQLWLLVQDLSQLQAVYPRWKSFLANMTLQVFGTQDIDTARYLSSMLGSETIEVQSAGTSTSYSDYRSTSGRSTNTSAMGRPLLTPDEVRRLDRQNVIVLEQGRPPVWLRRLNYLSDPEFVGLFDENPMHRR